jgi:hypothetical protein
LPVEKQPPVVFAHLIAVHLVILVKHRARFHDKVTRSLETRERSSIVSLPSAILPFPDPLSIRVSNTHATDGWMDGWMMTTMMMMTIATTTVRARSTHLGIGDDVLRNVGRALAYAHATPHGERFEIEIERPIERL